MTHPPDAVLPSASGATTQAARWGDYLALLKPRVMSLVIFTALTGLLCARTPMDPSLAAVAILCIAVGAGGSAALNMAFDADIDAVMRRTRRRPIPAGRVQASDARVLGVTLSLFSVGMMGLAVNWLAAGLLAFTIAFYVLVYTLWLKRRTPQNIVIGGLAGALPPLVGWAAASGSAPLNAWLLVAIIFVWTPPHFWALALYTTDDYAEAGVPMMPVVRGVRSTKRQILAYCLLLAPLGVAPAFTGLGGRLYLAIAIGGGLGLIALAIRLATARPAEGPLPRGHKETLYEVRPEARPARDVFAFSLIYLFGLFAALLLERVTGAASLFPQP
ncbi:MAG TPA: heme o synthase [Caulobacteraceae bacterium]|jgi:protoheme IX farnesyltransferase|nr:heme o synthase [Caulobacteraceae bacterium]